MLGALNQIINLFLKNISRIVNSNLILSKFSLSLKNRAKIIPIFILLTLAGLYAYFYYLGRPRFLIRSDIIVRKAGNDVQSFSFENFFASGNKGSLEDAKYLQTYLESPQVFEILQDKINFTEVFKKQGLDIFAGIKANISRDKKYRFFKKQVSVALDSSSGMIILRTFAYDPETTFLINNLLIEESEKFVNELNQGIYKKQINFVNEEVFSNYKKLEKTSTELSEFQRLNKLFDAQSEASAGIILINNLETQLAKSKIQLATLKRQFVNPNAPEIEYKKNEIDEIQEQINFEREQLVAPKGKDLTKKVQKLSELQNNLKFASDLYKSALSASEQNRIDSLRKQRFIAVINKPVKPEDQYNYWRHRGFLTSILIVIISFLLIKFLISVSDNRDI